MSKVILAVCGEMACGKGVVTEYLVDTYQASKYKFSIPLRDILNRLHVAVTRESLASLSLSLRQTFGEQVLSDAICQDISEDANDVVVLDGVRRLADIKRTKTLEGFKLAYVNADIETRCRRLVSRGENAGDETKSFEQFKADSLLESELQIKQLKKYADFVLENNGTKEQLYEQIDNMMRQINKNPKK